jgi:hypothetical protein
MGIISTHLTEISNTAAAATAAAAAATDVSSTLQRTECGCTVNCSYAVELYIHALLSQQPASEPLTWTFFNSVYFRRS